MTAVGVVLAGGAARRMGGAKATAALHGRPLLHYPLAALGEVCHERAVVAKPDTSLPPLPAGVPIWREPSEPRHPLVGILHALRMSRGRPVLCVAVDLPFLDAASLRLLLETGDGDHACVVPRTAEGLQPLCALWFPAAIEPLAQVPQGASMRAIVSSLRVREVTGVGPGRLVNLNTPEELARCPAPPAPGVPAER